jgi:hypothetical protein
MAFRFTSVIEKYSAKGEKTGWTYVSIPPDVLTRLRLKDKKGFRIKGSIDGVTFEKLSTYPVGNGEFIIALNGELRKKLRKNAGAPVTLSIALDTAEPLESKQLMECLKEDPEALEKFNKQLLSHRNYFHRYVDSAKTDATRAGRIVNVINAMHRGYNYGEMIRALKKI